MGEELTISYLEVTPEGLAAGDVGWRQAELREQWGFDCMCSLCVDQLSGVKCQSLGSVYATHTLPPLISAPCSCPCLAPCPYHALYHGPAPSGGPPPTVTTVAVAVAAVPAAILVHSQSAWCFPTLFRSPVELAFAPPQAPGESADTLPAVGSTKFIPRLLICRCASASATMAVQYMSWPPIAPIARGLDQGARGDGLQLIRG